VAPLVAGALDPAHDTVATAHHWAHQLSPRVSEALVTWVPAAFHGGVDDVLLAALLVAVERWRQQRGEPTGGGVLVDVERHGRDELFADLDVSRTVGWFTRAHPVPLRWPGTDLTAAWRGGPALSQVVKAVKEQVRAAPDGGVGYGLLRYLNPGTAAPLRMAVPPAAIGFNYLGRFTLAADPASADWELIPGPSVLGGAADGAAPLPYPVMVNAVTREGAHGPELRAVWTWAPRLVEDAAIRALAQAWADALARLVEHTATPGAGGLTPSDLPLLNLEQSEIDDIERSL
jgi:non-ribosomal peptide synthase protein (TIGR01720 family)